MDLAPGGTVAVGTLVVPEARRDWQPRAPIINPAEFNDLRLVVERLCELGVRVLLAEYLDGSLHWIDAVAGFDMQLFVHAHGYDVSERLRDPFFRNEYLRYRNSAGVITMSERSRATLIELGLPSERVHSVPYGVDVPLAFAERPQNPCVRVLAVGRMVAKKAPLLLLDAFRLAITADVADVRLDYVGGGPLLADAQRFVEHHQLHNSVTLHGAVPNREVKALMARADVFVQHSIKDPATGDEEGLPVAILEAMAAGLPVVATRHSAVPEAVVDRRTGFLVEEHDTTAMANRILDLARDPQLRRSMGYAGWTQALERFTWARERADLLSVLQLETLNA
jgi:glycosyltransferase involved in cell wall biosynthesis